MTRNIAIVDYGAGNLLSVSRAVEKCGGEPALVADPEAVLAADLLILPGVGAFKDGMSGLASRGLDEAVREFAASGRPLLGICLGMQMLASNSVEFGHHRGLDLIQGQVRPIIPAPAENGIAHKVPFIGWAGIQATRAKGFKDTPLRGIANGDSVYLLHSFHFEPEQERDLLATHDYDGVTVTAAVQRDNILGCQFHPEKSGPAGLKIIGEFLAA